MQVQLHHIAGREALLWEVGEEQFVDHAFACHPNGTLLFPCGMSGHDHAAGRAIGSHRDLGTVGEAAYHLAFGTLLHLIGGQVQACLDQRMIEQAIVLPTRHKRESSEIGEHGSIAILPIKVDQRALW
jgi:hypothetical protein